MELANVEVRCCQSYGTPAGPGEKRFYSTRPLYYSTSTNSFKSSRTFTSLYSSSLQYPGGTFVPKEVEAEEGTALIEIRVETVLPLRMYPFSLCSFIEGCNAMD